MSLELFPKPGDLIQFQKTYYTHWAVLVRDKYIIHVRAPNGGKEGNVIIAKMKLDDYLKSKLFNVPLWINVQSVSAASASPAFVFKVSKLEGCWASVNNNFDKVKKPFHVDEIIRRAEDMVGKKWDYDLLQHNCEHFTHWCRYGVKICKQSPNVMEYEDEDGNKHFCAQVGGTNVGPIDFKILGLNSGYESVPGRKEVHGNVELASVGVGNLARISLGPEGKVGRYADDDGLGFKVEATCVEANIGPASAKLGLGVSTGIDTKDGFKAEVLGTGAGLNKKGLEIKLLGSSVSVKWPWN